MSAMIAALLFTSLVAGTQPIELSRGCVLREPSGATSRYWSATDTTLDSHEADKNTGGSRMFTGGQGQVILIKFGDLNRVIGPGKKIVKASLLLTPSDTGSLKLERISQVLVPWGEGPCHTIEEPAIAPGTKPTAPRWSATWKHRRAGEAPIAWQKPGAQGSEDATLIEGATLTTRGDGQVEIGGLEGCVERQYERWYENNGFAITFAPAATFYSSKSAKGRPTLVLQVEDAAPKTGPDLSVTTIERTPEYERYDNRNAYTFKDQGGESVGVMDKPGSADSQKWPKDGETVTYTAHVKNVGDAPSQGFTGQWIVREATGPTVTFDKELKPGEETTVVYSKPYKGNKVDHRVQPIGFRVFPKGPDACAGNDYLEIQEHALSVGIYVEKGFYDAVSSQANLLGSRSFEDWIQSQFRVWNDVYFPFSRCSFAPDGILERTRVQRIVVVPDGSLQGPQHLPDGKPNLNYDAEWGFPASDAAKLGESTQILGADRGLLKALSLQIGLIDLEAMEMPAGMPDGTGGKVRLKDGGTTITRGAMDVFSGLMGGGDTRNESMLLNESSIPMEPSDDPVLEAAELEPTDLYSKTDVAALNSSIGFRRGYAGEFLYDLRQPVILQVIDSAGKAIPEAELAFFQSAKGEIPDSAAAFSVTTDKAGFAILPSRPTLNDAPVTTLTGHTLKPNPFGRLDVQGGNGTFLVRCTRKGGVDWSWLKAWQLVDDKYRGQSIVPLRFQTTSEALDTSVDYAKNRIVTDSADSLPAQLAPLTAGTFAKPVPFGAKEGDWVEIDLGRDRAIGEIRLFARSPEFWQKFDVIVYSTGQKASDGRLWSHEADWSYAAANRRDVDPKDFGLYSVAYRSQAENFRFVRIVCREATPSASLVGITVTPVKPTP
jgi:hypothetical protein